MLDRVALGGRGRLRDCCSQEGLSGSGLDRALTKLPCGEY